MDNKPSKKRLIDYMTLSRKNKYGNYPPDFRRYG